MNDVLEQLSAQEQMGLQMLCADNDGMKQVAIAVAERQRGSAAFHNRALKSLSATHPMLAYEAPLLPPCIERATGGRIVDIDGNEYVDCHLAYTSALLGHNPEPVRAAVEQALARGVGAAHGFNEQAELAELVKAMVPGLERVALFHTGGETLSAAVRLTRAVTGRRRVAKFEGCYHGSNDVGLHNSWLAFSGRPPVDPLGAIKPAAATGGVMTGSDDDYLILPFNSPLALERLREHAKELACVVVDPLPVWMSNWPDQARQFVAELLLFKNGRRRRITNIKNAE